VFLFRHYFSYIVTVGETGSSTRRKPPTCRKSSTNFITQSLKLWFALLCLYMKYCRLQRWQTCINFCMGADIFQGMQLRTCIRCIRKKIECGRLSESIFTPLKLRVLFSVIIFFYYLMNVVLPNSLHFQSIQSGISTNTNTQNCTWLLTKYLYNSDLFIEHYYD
jgi:hypothetical protein